MESWKENSTPAQLSLLQISASVNDLLSKKSRGKEGETGGKEGRWGMEREGLKVVPLRKDKVSEEQAVSKPMSTCFKDCL